MEILTQFNKLARVPILVPTHSSHSHQFHSTKSHPINKNGYRYTSCGPSTTPLHATIPSTPDNTRFSWEDRSPFVFITKDAKTITTQKGWRGARANVPIRQGAFYWEVKIERGGDASTALGAWVRVGLGRRESSLNAPVGIDGYSYSIRDKTGHKITRARPVPYAKPFQSHSTIGIYLQLPNRDPIDPADPDSPAKIVRKRVAIRYKGQLFYESLEYKPSEEMLQLNEDPANKSKTTIEEIKIAPGMKTKPKAKDTTPPLRDIPTLPGSKIVFFIDGECQGVAFENLFDFLPLRQHEGTRKQEVKKSASGILNVLENWQDDGALGYFPAVSVFGGGIATLNPGPEFDYPPPLNINSILHDSPHPPTSTIPATDWRPLCERYDEFNDEQRILDAIDEEEALLAFSKLEKEVGSSPKKSKTNLSSISAGMDSGRATPMDDEEMGDLDRQEVKLELEELN